MKHLALTLCALLAAACTTPAPDETSPGAELAIVGARVYPAPGAAPVIDATIFVRNGVIAKVGPSSTLHASPSAQVIDGHGLTVVAGLWNSHIHLFSPTLSQPPETNARALAGELEAMLTRWGFTSVFDIASLPGQAIALRKRINAGEIPGPNILTVDAPIFPLNGTPIYARELLRGQPSFEVGDPALAATRVRTELAAGADGVKLFTGALVGKPLGVLPMQLDVAKAAVAEAHRLGKPVFAHPSDLAGLAIAMDSGVDILAHTTPDNGLEWTPDLVAKLRTHKLALIPTLTLWGVELKNDRAPDATVKAFTAVAQRQLKMYADAGGEILFGTDVGYTQAFDTTEEYRLMSGAGLTFNQILGSLTTTPSARFGFTKKGRVAAGMDGDLTVLSVDPATDITGFAKVVYTIRAGQVIYAAKK
ncbi:MAG: amidohydrolase family protein [Hyphomonadaceae bacterium]